METKKSQLKTSILNKETNPVQKTKETHEIIEDDLKTVNFLVCEEDQKRQTLVSQVDL